MKPYTAVIIATKGRPEEVSNLLDTLARQTVSPDRIVVSACDCSDLPPSDVGKKGIDVLFGPPGLAAQRNRGLSVVREKSDIIIFFDDDFIPSRFWIERVQLLLATHPGIVCVTGHVLKDGATIGGLGWSEGQSIVDKADAPKKTTPMNDYTMQDHQFPYGCNMAFRAKSIEHLDFDERLVLYGWLEDRDFAVRAATGSTMIRTNAVWGVHLGTKHGRPPGLGFGYSQVVNAWYLMKKGSMRPFDAYRNIFRVFAANTLGMFIENSHVDRWGRLKGNIIGMKDITIGRWEPEKTAELNLRGR